MDTGTRHRALLGCCGDLLDSWEAGGLRKDGIWRVVGRKLRRRSVKQRQITSHNIRGISFYWPILIAPL